MPNIIVGKLSARIIEVPALSIFRIVFIVIVLLSNNSEHNLNNKRILEEYNNCGGTVLRHKVNIVILTHDGLVLASKDDSLGSVEGFMSLSRHLAIKTFLASPKPVNFEPFQIIYSACRISRTSFLELLNCGFNQKRLTKTKKEDVL